MHYVAPPEVPPLPPTGTSIQARQIFVPAKSAVPLSGRPLSSMKGHFEDPMPDLYAINLHLQERLERDWREEVRAGEAADWLDRTGLLADRQGGLLLRTLLRAGRIAGQEQRPNKKNGAWWIRRLAKSRDPDSIRKARKRLRRYLPIDRTAFPTDWPASQGTPVFWQEFGKTVAAFGYLEYIMAAACYALLATGERAIALLYADRDALSRWYNRLIRSQIDSMRGLTVEFDRVLRESGRIPHKVRKDLVERLDELRPWRNALCHGAWLSIDRDGPGHLQHLYLEEGVPVAFEPKFTLKNLSDIRARTAETIFRVAEAASIAGPDNTYAAGPGFAFVVGMPREYEPRHAPPEQE